MGLFVCDECGAIENTSFGVYWERDLNNFEDESLKGKALCSDCTPEKYSDGRYTRCKGTWHGRFKKMTATKKEILSSDPRNFVYLGSFEHLRKAIK